MKRGRFLWTCCFGLLTLLACWQSVYPEPSEVKSNPKYADLLRFTVKAIPQDASAPSKSDGAPKIRRNQIVKIVLIGTPKSGYHTYPLTKRTSSQLPVQLSRMEFGKVTGVTLLWPITETEP